MPHDIRMPSSLDGRNARVVAVLGLLALAGSSVYYMLAVQTFPVEVSVSSSALAWRNGQPLYHAMDAAERHSLLYGPVLYAFARLCSGLISDPLLAGKLGAASCCVVGLAAIYRAARMRLGSSGALCMAGFTASFLLCFNTKALGARGDAPLFALAALAIAILPGEGQREGRPLLRAAAIGTFIGLAMGIKLHAFVYFIPAVASLVGFGYAIGSLTIAGLFAVVVIAAPFVLFEQVSLVHYSEWLQQASDHPLLIATGKHGMIWTGLLILPLIAALAFDSNRRDWLRRERLILAGFALSAIATVIFSSKHGAGRHHVIPLIPSAVWIWALALASPTRTLSVRGRRIFDRSLLGALSLYLVFGLFKMGEILNRLEPARARSARAELFQIFEREAGHSIAVGYGQPPAPNYLRAYPIEAGHPNLIDEITLMDTSVTGLGVPDQTISLIESCAVDVWIQPTGFPPFVRLNYYATTENIFGPKLPSAFHASYTLDYSLEHLSVWRCARETP